MTTPERITNPYMRHDLARDATDAADRIGRECTHLEQNAAMAHSEVQRRSMLKRAATIRNMLVPIFEALRELER